MAGKYYTPAVSTDYLKDVEATGTGTQLTTTELSRAESFADNYIDLTFRMFARGAWDATAGYTTPPVIKEIGALLSASVVQRILNVRSNFDYAEEDSLAKRLWNQAHLLIDMVLEAGAVPLADGSIQLPVAGRGRGVLYVEEPSTYLLECDENYDALSVAVEYENLFARANLRSPLFSN